MFLRLALALSVLLALLTCGSSAQAQDNIQRGKLKSLDIEKKQLVVTVEGKDRELTLNDQTQVLGGEGKDLAEKLKDFKAGSDIFFQAAERDGKQVARGLKLVGPGEKSPTAGGKPNIQRGTFVKYDADAKMITLKAGDKEQTATINDRTQFRGNGSLTDALKGLKAGAEVQFVIQSQDGKDFLAGLAIGGGGGRPAAGGDQPREGGPRVSPDHKDFKPLTELGTGKYKDFEGGLYPGGKNERPATHEEAGKKLAADVKPLDADGKPSDGGKIVLLSIGMSNASQASQGFERALADFDQKNPQLQFVNGAQGGMTAEVIDDPDDGGRGAQYWRVVDDRLKQAGVTRAQVQAAWIKQADAGPRQGFPEYAKKLQAEQKTIVQILHDRFPNLKLCYLSSRTYGGYATTALNPEPYAYESGFGVKWLIEEQLGDDAGLNFDPAKGAVKAPWLSWGPYLWANGATKRDDGYSYDASDFGGDGTHHSPAGSLKIGQHMLEFFKSDSTTKPWFLKP
jgi:Cu/Ag efflux protein CusF